MIICQTFAWDINVPMDFWSETISQNVMSNPDDSIKPITKLFENVWHLDFCRRQTCSTKFHKNCQKCQNFGKTIILKLVSPYDCLSNCIIEFLLPFKLRLFIYKYKYA